MARKAKGIKTNAMRMAEQKKIIYKAHSYEVPEGFIHGVSAAETLGEDPARVFKTLVLEGRSKEHYVCVIPADCELDLKKAAGYFGEKNIEMVHVKDLLPLTGYVRGGCSPIGMKKQFKTAVHFTARNFGTVFVSGGRPGSQIELDPEDLRDMTGGAFADLIKE